ncbi:MAG: DoxX family membrane protein [Fimbriimonadaceae bacterium]|nr:DoxX family membrane protein [Fimbriimonadaceae bacterium]
MAISLTSAGSQTDASNRAYTLLKYTFGLVPIVAGLDKFTNLLTDWSTYLSPAVKGALPFAPSTFMMIVGAIEITAGILVLSRYTRYAAYIVAAWLALIAANLLMAGRYDVAVRDLVMAITAIALGELAKERP